MFYLKLFTDTVVSLINKYTNFSSGKIAYGLNGTEGQLQFECK